MSNTQHRPGVTMEVSVGDEIKIDGGRITVKVEHKSGQKARLRIVAPQSMPIEWPKKIPAFTG